MEKGQKNALLQLPILGAKITVEKRTAGILAGVFGISVAHLLNPGSAGANGYSYDFEYKHLPSSFIQTKYNGEAQKSDALSTSSTLLITMPDKVEGKDTLSIYGSYNSYHEWKNDSKYNKHLENLGLKHDTIESYGSNSLGYADTKDEWKNVSTEKATDRKMEVLQKLLFLSSQPLYRVNEGKVEHCYSAVDKDDAFDWAKVFREEVKLHKSLGTKNVFVENESALFYLHSLSNVLEQTAIYREYYHDKKYNGDFIDKIYLDNVSNILLDYQNILGDKDAVFHMSKVQKEGIARKITMTLKYISKMYQEGYAPGTKEQQYEHLEKLRDLATLVDTYIKEDKKSEPFYKLNQMNQVFLGESTMALMQIDGKDMRDKDYNAMNKYKWDAQLRLVAIGGDYKFANIDQMYASVINLPLEKEVQQAKTDKHLDPLLIAFNTGKSNEEVMRLWKDAAEGMSKSGQDMAKMEKLSQRLARNVTPVEKNTDYDTHEKEEWVKKEVGGVTQLVREKVTYATLGDHFVIENVSNEYMYVEFRDVARMYTKYGFGPADTKHTNKGFILAPKGKGELSKATLSVVSRSFEGLTKMNYVDGGDMPAHYAYPMDMAKKKPIGFSGSNLFDHALQAALQNAKIAQDFAKAKKHASLPNFTAEIKRIVRIPDQKDLLSINTQQIAVMKEYKKKLDEVL